MTLRRTRARMGVLGCVCLSLGTACAVKGEHVLVDNYQAPGEPGEAYVILPGDLISVRVFQHDNMSAQGRVRADGRLTLPLLNEVTVAGHTPVALAQQLQTRLQEYIHSPSVTVSVEAVHPLDISILGEVNRPGIYPLERGAGIFQALAAGGGMTNFARRRIFVIREKPGASPARILFSWEALCRAEGEAARFKLRPGDVVLIE